MTVKNILSASAANCFARWHFGVALALGLAVLGAGGCRAQQGDGGGSANCPAPDDVAMVNLGCVPSQPPLVATTGPCTASAAQNGQDIMLTSTDAGTCHVEMTFGNGATSSVDVDFVAVSRPYGCGQEFVAVTADGGPCIPNGCQLSVPKPMCDAGLDAEPSV
jgi:hypothetical protein